MKAKNEPIVLSGRVYLDGILAEDLSSLALPARLLVGDIKLHNVNQPGKRQRYGQPISFSGFIVANVFDGNRFRRLLLRKLGAVESTYVGVVERRERSASIVRYLRTLVRRQAIWFGEQSGYMVTNQTVAAPPVSAAVASQSAPVNAAPQPVNTAPVTAAKTEAEAKPASDRPAQGRAPLAAKMTVKRRRRTTRKTDPNQLPLFKELK